MVLLMVLLQLLLSLRILRSLRSKAVVAEVEVEELDADSTENALQSVRLSRSSSRIGSSGGVEASEKPCKVPAQWKGEAGQQEEDRDEENKGKQRQE